MHTKLYIYVFKNNNNITIYNKILLIIYLYYFEISEIYNKQIKISCNIYPFKSNQKVYKYINY